MGVISSANFLILTDSIAWTYAKFLIGMGTDGTEVDTTSDAGKLNRNRVLALNDFDQENDLLAAFEATLTRLGAPFTAPGLFQAAVRALQNHVGGIDPFLTAAVVRVAPEFLTVYQGVTSIWLDPANVFSPVVPSMGTFVASAPDTGIYAHVAAIDSSKYYAANLVVEVTGAPTGIGAGTYSVTCKKWDDTTEIKTAVIPGGSIVGFQVDLGTHPADRYKDITMITLAGGQAADAIKVTSQLERTVVK